MDKQAHDSQWDEVLRAQEAGDEDRVMQLSRSLSDAGDWRGSYMLGYVHDAKAERASVRSGAKDTQNFIAAAHWHTRALAQHEQYLSHDRLAAYYYYGLGGQYDFASAYRHLKYCVEDEGFARNRDAKALRSVVLNRIKLAELLFLGLGAPKDAHAARKLFAEAAQAGYVAAVMGLSRMEKAEKHYLAALYYYLRAWRIAVRLRKEDPNHRLLAGMGGPYRAIRRGWLQRRK